MLGGAARERGHGDLDRDDDRYGDPGHLAHYTGEMRRRDPDLLGGLLGGGGGMAGGGASGGGNPVARALAGWGRPGDG